MLAATSLAGSAGAGQTGDLLAEAERAAREGVIEVSIIKLEQYLQGSPDPASSRRARMLLAEDFLNVRKGTEALRVLAGPDLPVPEADFLRARAALRLQRWDTAEKTYTRLLQTAPEPALQERARLGLAAARYGAKDLDGALKVLDSLLQAPAPLNERAVLLAAQICLEQARFSDAQAWLDRLGNPGPREAILRRCLQGELFLKQGHTSQARQAFEDVVNATTGKTGRALVIAQTGLSQIDLAAQDFEDAETRIEKVIADQPRTPLLPQLFRTLFNIYTLESSASGSDLAGWSAEDPAVAGPERPAYALFYLGKLAQNQGAAERAHDLFKQTAQRFADQAAASLAMMELAQDDLSAGRTDEAIRRLAGTEPQKLGNEERTAWCALLAEAYAHKGSFDQAHAAYGRALETAGGPTRARVLYNMALCALRLRKDQLFADDRKALLEADPESAWSGELEFQKGRLEAAAGDRRAATQTLRQFLAHYPNHARVSEAHLLLAECTYQAKPVNFTRVADELSKDVPADPKLTEQKERLAFFAAADDPDASLTDAPRLAEAFFAHYPTSPARAEIHLKLGEVYFQANDYANARTQFELVPDEQPESPLVEAALFLAGEAARRSLNPSSVDEAIALFEEVYKLGGTLRFQARLEQAYAKRQVHQESEAITLLDDLLALKPPADIRLQALEAKGQAQFALGAQDPASYPQAKETFAALANPENPVDWRQRGLYQAGKCFEKLGRPDDALAAYYDTLDLVGTTGDQVWFFRAGFDAAQILEQRHAWSSAGAVYEKLANTRSGRAAEARERLTKLRLEHFLWPD
ncbi:MAG: tetratricopeptide repeat protein [Verrucomicrobia bacterium]|nr:tetratricopeptide repeat protein [Verrucomicrobiota bacterium]